MPPTGAAIATDQNYEKIEPHAAEDALVTMTKVEMINELAKLKGVTFYRHRESGEIMFAEGDTKPWLAARKDE